MDSKQVAELGRILVDSALTFLADKNQVTSRQIAECIQDGDIILTKHFIECLRLGLQAATDLVKTGDLLAI